VLAGVPVLAAVSAPSSLAAELAGDAGLTLAGFVRGGSMNIYAGGQRVIAPHLPSDDRAADASALTVWSARSVSVS